MKEHKRRVSYGSANLVISDVSDFLDFYVTHARPLLTKRVSESALFPSSDPWEDLGVICVMFDAKKSSPTLLRKAASTAAYSDLSELDRRKSRTICHTVQKQLLRRMRRKTDVLMQ